MRTATSPPPGGGVESLEVSQARTGGGLIRRFFFRAREFWEFKRNQGNQKPSLISGSTARAVARERIYFPKGGGGIKSLEPFDPGPAG